MYEFFLEFHNEFVKLVHIFLCRDLIVTIKQIAYSIYTFLYPFPSCSLLTSIKIEVDIINWADWNFSQIFSSNLKSW